MLKALFEKLLNVALTTVVVVLILKYLSPLPLSIESKTKDSFFYVSADGNVFVKPDLASIVFGVELTRPTALQAKSDVNDIVNKVTEEIKKLGVKDENIQTINFSVEPSYQSNEPPIKVGAPNLYPTNNIPYKANVSIRVKEKDLEKVERIIDTALNNQVSQTYDLTFEVEDKEKSLDDARKIAIQNAKEKAKKIAAETGIKLGKITNMTEFYPYDYGTYGDYGKAAGGGGGETNLSAGQSEIKVSVTLTFETL